MNNKLGNYLKNLRTIKKKSLRQVESETKISNAHLSQIEKGGIEKPAIDLLESLATYYQVQPSYLKTLAGYGDQESQAAPDTRLTPLKYITATQLDTFANTKEAEGLLPELIRDLIVSTVICDSLEMPAGGSIFMHGWDGLLECKVKPEVQFVPQGFSCWEMSKAKNVTKKSEQDFKKRTKNPLRQSIENSTYVQVSFIRISKNQKAQILASSKNTSWKEVKVIDAEDLELWLERNPVLALSYAKKMGLFPSSPGLLPLNDFWSQWWASTDPAIDQSLLLEAGKRCDDAKDFVTADNLNHLKIKSNNVHVGLAFFYAIVTSLENQTVVQSLISRSIIIENEDAFRLLATRGKRLILIPIFKGAPIGEAKLNGHRIVSIVNNFDPTDLDAVGRVRTSVMSEFLKIEGGYSDEKACRLAKSCYGNLSVLRLMLADEAEVACPVWSKPDFGNAILPMVMLGGWDSRNEADQSIIQKINQKNYEETEHFLESIPEDNTHLFHKLNHSYSFYQEYCYVHLNKYLSLKVLDAFFAVAKEVLCEINSKYELEPARRFAADIYKKGQRYSRQLRIGVATSLAMLANMNLSALPYLQLRIDNLINEILDNESDWKFWASLSDIIVLLAEASPSAFLNKIEKACRTNEFVEIFKQTTTMGGCDYSAILWSLESCAWERKHFKQVSKILMFMADRENKENNYVNQPSNSLWNIHRIWANQSTTLFQERMQVLKELEEVNSSQVWILLLRLIPKSHESGSYTYRPRFRDIEFDSHSKESDSNYITVMNALVDYILYFLEKDKTKWVDALDLIFNVRPSSYQLRLLDTLLAVNKEDIPEEFRIKIWRELEKKLGHHLEFPDADWSAKSTSLLKLKKAYARFTPKDLVLKWSHVFDYYLSHPEIENVNHDYNKKQDALRDLQKKALKELLPTRNLQLLESILSNVPNSWILGMVFAETFDNLDIAAIRIAQANLKGSDFIGGLLCTFYRNKGEAWLEDCLKHDLFSESKIRTKLFLSLPYGQKIWDRLNKENQSIQDEFWKNVKRSFVLENYDEAIFVINKLMDYERPLDAFYVLANFENRRKNLVPSVLSMKVLDAIVNYDLSSDANSIDFSLFDYHLEKILKELSIRTDVDKRKLAIIEWNFLPLFKYHKKPENLTDEVNQDPELFTDILKIAYKKDDLTTDEPRNEEAISRAYQFLHDNETLPGMGKTGVFDPEHFQNWFLKANSLAAQCNRVEAFDSVFGQLLAYSPNDPEDKGWPHKAIRDIFEKYGTEKMERGLSSGIFNKRGVFIKSLGEGGTQEKQLARKYRDYAKICEISWPKIAKVLRHLESQYSVDAHSEDLNALHE